MARRPDPALAIYLKQINRFELLSPDEEIELARRVRQGDSHARSRMIRANLRLVVNIARKYVGRGLPLADLIEEGNLGLMRAVEGFDPEMGCRFSTYASWWIRQSVRRALIDSIRPIRIPAYMVELIARLKSVQAKLTDEKGRSPTIEEIAREMKLKPQKVAVIRRAIRAIASADQPMDADSRFTLSEMIPDHRTPRPEERIFDQQEAEMITQLLDAIDEREAKVLRLRFGIEDNEPMTLKAIGEELGLTRERIRQIEKEALGKLADILRRRRQTLSAVDIPARPSPPRGRRKRKKQE